MKTPLITTIILLLTITLVSAANGWNYYSSPMDYLQNEWVMFGIIFMVLFAIIYFAISNALKGNKAVAVIIATGISLLITMTMSQRGLLYSYVGSALGSWISIIALLLAAGFLIKVANENFGKVGAVAAVIGFWIFLNLADTYDFLPDELVYGNLSEFYNFFASGVGLFILIVISLIVLSVIPTRLKPYQDILKGLGLKN